MKDLKQEGAGYFRLYNSQNISPFPDHLLRDLTSQEKKSKSRHDTGAIRDVQRILSIKSVSCGMSSLVTDWNFKPRPLGWARTTNTVKTDLTFCYEEMDMN
jgi:hypothetical protein